jgi:hypothetical protein
MPTGEGDLFPFFLNDFLNFVSAAKNLKKKILISELKVFTNRFYLLMNEIKSCQIKNKSFSFQMEIGGLHYRNKRKEGIDGGRPSLLQ